MHGSAHAMLTRVANLITVFPLVSVHGGLLIYCTEETAVVTHWFLLLSTALLCSVSALLSSYAAHPDFHPTQVLPVLPSDWPLGVVADYLSQA